MKLRHGLALGGATMILAVGLARAVDGYKDTPLLPGGQWHVHDPDRPQPPVVDAGPGPVEPIPAPEGVKLLFSGDSLEAWQTDGGAPTWKIENGYFECVPGKGGINTKERFGDLQIHLEWSIPPGTGGSGQGRGNSGVFFLNGAFEIQILDCHGNQTYADGTAGALYGQYPPLANPCRKQGDWNVYDITFRGPRYEEGKLVRPATAHVVFNGVVVQDNQAFLGTTVWRQLAKYPDRPLATRGNIQLQNHGNAVRFRNIWVKELTD